VSQPEPAYRAVDVGGGFRSTDGRKSLVERSENGGLPSSLGDRRCAGEAIAAGRLRLLTKRLAYDERGFQ
jgi:hypothetical protein